MSSEDFSSPWPEEDRVRHATLDAGLHRLSALISEMRADGRIGPFEVPTIRMVNEDGSEVSPEGFAAELRRAPADED